MSKRTWTFKLEQDGIIVAEVYAPTAERGYREIMHYAMMYSQDGPCTVHLPKGFTPQHPMTARQACLRCGV